MDVCMMVYWNRVHDDMFETCIKTFRKNSDALLQVYSDSNNIPTVDDMVIRKVSEDRVKGRRALCKIECLQELYQQLQDGDKLLVSDIDVYFLDDPFTAFEQDFDLGLTLRHYQHILPINAGIYYMHINPKMREFMTFRLGQLNTPTWDKYITFEQIVRGNPKYPLEMQDWYIDQDFLNTVWINKEDMDIKVVDVGWEYNFCPPSDVIGYVEACKEIKKAYEEKSAITLHLKSSLKYAIYEDYLVDAVNTGDKGVTNWQTGK